MIESSLSVATTDNIGKLDTGRSKLTRGILGNVVAARLHSTEGHFLKVSNQGSHSRFDTVVIHGRSLLTDVTGKLVPAGFHPMPRQSGITDMAVAAIANQKRVPTLSAGKVGSTQLPELKAATGKRLLKGMNGMTLGCIISDTTATRWRSSATISKSLSDGVPRRNPQNQIKWCSCHFRYSQ
jgi:hypothetical protein